MQLILVRHGLPERAHSRDAVNPGLSEEGLEQARQTCARLGRERIDQIYSSPLIRAVDTARPLSEALGLPILQVEDIGEVDDGKDAYISPEAIRAAGDWERFLKDPIRYYGHDEEAFRARVMSGFDRIMSAGANRVAVFTHGFPINILLASVLSLPRITHFVPRNGSITRLAGDTTASLRVLSINETSHFDERVVR